ncbi:MAG: heme-binding protein [Nannocystales bacterium]
MAASIQSQYDKSRPRSIGPARPDDPDLGPLQLLPGTWKSQGRGWNIIALPFATDPPPAGFNYRILMNQYDETLSFTVVSKGVPNRGIARSAGGVVDTDQTLIALDYQQLVNQVAVDDFPSSDDGSGGHKRGKVGDGIHHEPGLWLHMLDERTNDLDIARLATVPHGDSVLALGKSEEHDGPPCIPVLNGLPVGVPPDLDSAYLSPYKHYEDHPFVGTENAAGFPGFHPTDLNALLRLANNGLDVARTTTLHVDSDTPTGGVVNIPFVTKQANATTMRSTFWISEINDGDTTRLQLQYSQLVMLDFFNRPDGQGLIRWPHVSINTLQKVL